MALLSNSSMIMNVCVLIVVIILLIAFVERIKHYSSTRKSIAVLVLGDIGRSPRMLRHAQSFINNLNDNYDVHLVGFLISGIPSRLKNNSRVHLHNITSYKMNVTQGSKISFLFYAFFKISSEILSLFWILILSQKMSPLTHIIMQNPPSVPIVIIAKITSIIKGSIFIIDWHNFGFSILALKQTGFVVKMYKLIERHVGKLADIHLTVTKEMKKFLKIYWKFNDKNIHCLYDRATLKFINKTINDKDDKKLWDIDIKKHFNKDNIKNLKQAKDDNLWMISSTSWTPDEDLNMLLDDKVLQNINEEIKSLDKDKRRKIVLFITGKDEGNLRTEFEGKLKDLSLEYIDVITIWLGSHDNYIHLLKWCDIGLCFHKSSSGLDLPMKVVDMFGVNIPVIAINFDEIEMKKIMGIDNDDVKCALNELVQHNQRGLIFDKPQELTKYVLDVYNDRDCELIKKFKGNIESFRKYRWDTEWKKVMTNTRCFEDFQ